MKNNEIILTLETSQRTLSVALSFGNDVIAEYSCYSSNAHDKLLALYAQRLIADHLSGDFSKLNYVALSAGPGSFTGLRIGAAFAKGLCFGSEIKILAVPTLQAIALEAKSHLKSEHKRIISVLPSHKEQVYFQLFDLNSTPLGDIEFENYEIFQNIITDGDFICGIIPEELNLAATSIFPNSRIICNYALQMIANEEFAEIETFEPIYVSEFIPKTATKKLNI
ncbi:MAG: tRNA (adenosine(37)-N6)-threonylcarbamoyltransferase complex dimerization subunit type 1 TsaB [Ignavibacteriae bacterium HGW-Ignavibacteriae-1]|jgi:tRNA threonylcarbamoyladenosine biosynthesis protein TsaB|nr:MAG: tRNA (adenosine(37)-N6)-threonylcarbamoyltransferase complex dimerization subunit type 1 TsaB [Ignavibacteriae bacterium HGW-Ignavibacteriae-1]